MFRDASKNLSKFCQSGEILISPKGNITQEQGIDIAKSTTCRYGKPYHVASEKDIRALHITNKDVDRVLNDKKVWVLTSDVNKFGGPVTIGFVSDGGKGGWLDTYNPKDADYRGWLVLVPDTFKVAVSQYGIPLIVQHRAEIPAAAP
jgi:hypothetical protein